MKQRSLQVIEDFYVARGYDGEKLREALSEDKEYQRLLRKRKRQLAKAYRVTAAERRRYVLSTDADFEILTRCRQLERKRLTANDKATVALIKAQLGEEWRKGLLATLERLKKRYQNNK